MKVSIFNDAWDVNAVKHADVTKVLEAIKNGYWKERTAELRAIRARSEDEYKKAKPKTPGITFSGMFEIRRAEELIEHSGLMSIDFDHLADSKEDLKTTLRSDDYIYSFFESPSGDGIKALVKIPTDDHLGSFYALEKRYPSIDPQCKDTNRLCFVSYDPELYLNEDSKVFYDKVKPEEKQTVSTGGVFEPLQEGSRNGTLAKAIGVLLKTSSLSQKNISDIIHAVNGYSENPLEKREVDSVLNSILRKDDREVTEDTIHELLMKSHVDLLVDLPPPPVCMKIKTLDEQIGYVEQRLFTLGNISCTTGKAKSKKSLLSSLLLAASSSNGLIYDKFIGCLPDGKTLSLLFDTEQADYDTQVLGKKVIESGGNVNQVNVFCFREFKNEDRIRLIEHALEKYGKYTGFVVIDGIADLLKSINDEEEANKVVQMLMKWSKEYNIHINVILHQNKDNDWATGHIGSAVMKKSECVISVKKNQDHQHISTVKCTMIRGVAPFKDFDIQIIGGQINVVNNLTRKQDEKEDDPHYQ